MANAKKASGKGKRTKNQRAANGQVLIVDEGARNDIAGVAICVLAVALAFALFSQSQAIITSTVHTGLIRGFGAGAMLVPVALLLFGATFFVTTDTPLSARVAIGLGLVVVAVLSLLSVNAPGAAENPESVLLDPILSSAGGYVGGGVAWVLLRLVGAGVGDVLLSGVIIAGIIVCGFSVSDLVAKVRGQAVRVAEEAREARSARAARRAEAKARAMEQQPEWEPERDSGPVKSFRRARNIPQASLLDENGEAVTTYLGDRKTSVLRRPQEVAPTTLLDRGDVEEPPALEPLPEEAVAASGAVPAFLAGKQDQPKTQAKPKAKKPAKRKSTKASSEPEPAKRPGEGGEYQLPPLSMLASSEGSYSTASQSELTKTANKLQATLEEFGLTSRVMGWTTGPTVTTFKVAMGEGERVSKLTNLQDDIALSLAAKSVRIFSPIPGTSLVGIEIPNQDKASVPLGDVLPYVQGGPLDTAFGRDSEGNPVVVDLAGLPHLLVAGTTGSGKSVFLNALIMSIIMRATPEQVRFIMVDPKRVEFTFYEGLPHLYVPVVTDSHKAASALQWGVAEMERRLKVFEKYRVRDITSYNKMVEKGTWDKETMAEPQRIPYFVIVIDELSDLMIVAGKEVEASIVRIAQLGRAAGIHLLVATQRPSADVVTGLIKANIDNRVALAVDNGMNSRIILDQNGAEKLLGQGDMLYKLRGRRPIRAQSCFQSEEEVASVVEFLKGQCEADYHDEILSAVSPGMAMGGAASSGGGNSDDDPLVWEAAKLVVDSQLGSTSALQRHLKVGYARAGRIMDMLEQKGVVGPPDGSKPREVLLDAAGLEELRSAEMAYEEV